MSNLDEIEKLDSLSSTRVEEVKASTKSTFCFRQNWVHSTYQPSLSRLMVKFPKFRIIPELIDMEFQLKYSDCMVDILKTFNQSVADPVLKYASLSNSDYIKALAIMASKKHHDWKAYYACKLESPYPVILIQGIEGEKILSIKIAFEKTLIEAGTSIVEGIDRLFKIFWCFNIEYQPLTIMFWQFLQDIFGLQYGSLPNGVIELRLTLSKYVFT
nr:uncharacterized protein LOC124816159 [Hydra vulgaris]